jgi:hypothetical protein
MYLPKSDIYAALSTIPNIKVRQASQKTAAVIPSITFSIADNLPEYDLDNEITKQDILVTVDIWASNGAEGDSLLSQAETKMRELGYRLSFCIDVPDPDNICHINTRFTGIK